MGYYLLIMVFMLMEGYFSGSETGAYCLNKIRLRYRAEQKWQSAVILQKLLTDPQGLICTTLIGTNVAVYLSTSLLTSRIDHMGIAAPEVVSTFCLSPILLIFAEATPKNLFQARADLLMYKLAPALAFFRQLFRPGVWVLKKITGMFSSPVVDDRNVPFSAARLGFFLDQGAQEGVLSPYQRAMARNVMRLGQVPVEKVMIPLKDVASIPKSASREEVRNVAAAKRYSRMPVYDESPEQVVGILNLLDFFSAEDGRDIDDLMRPVITIPQRTPIHDILHTLQHASYPMGVVVDDNAKAIGIVTIKDLVEEIVGELEVW